PPPVCHATVRAAVAAAVRLAPALPLFAGGRSFGGRMTSQAQALEPLPGVRGLAFLGFPLHPAGRPADSRARHLFEVQIPMLFIQGTRDALAERGLLEGIVGRLGARATLSLLEDADHSFHVPARSGRRDPEVRSAAWRALAEWIGSRSSAAAPSCATPPGAPLRAPPRRPRERRRRVPVRCCSASRNTRRGGRITAAGCGS